MSFGLVAAVILVFVAVAFALQNNEPITIHFFSWTFEGSLVLVLLTTLALGIIISVLAALPSQIKKSRTITQQQKTIDNLESALPAHKRSSMPTGTS